MSLSHCTRTRKVLYVLDGMACYRNVCAPYNKPLMIGTIVPLFARLSFCVTLFLVEWFAITTTKPQNTLLVGPSKCKSSFALWWRDWFEAAGRFPLVLILDSLSSIATIYMFISMTRLDVFFFVVVRWWCTTVSSVECGVVLSVRTIISYPRQTVEHWTPKSCTWRHKAELSCIAPSPPALHLPHSNWFARAIFARGVFQLVAVQLSFSLVYHTSVLNSSTQNSTPQVGALFQCARLLLAFQVFKSRRERIKCMFVGKSSQCRVRVLMIVPGQDAFCCCLLATDKTASPVQALLQLSALTTLTVRLT